MAIQSNVWRPYLEIQPTDWRPYLAPNSEIPTDVTFKVLGKDRDTEPADYDCGEIAAHRLILAGPSKVFRKMFFGPMKEPDVVVVKDSTIQAFTAMINYIYTPPGEKMFPLYELSCPLIWDILVVSEKYGVTGLKEAASDALEFFPLTEENILLTAATAKNFEHTIFEDVAKMLTTRCLGFINELQTAEEVFSLILKSRQTFPEADRPGLLTELLLLRAREEETTHNCLNCLRRASDCLDGKEVNREEDPSALREGLRVRIVYIGCKPLDGAGQHISLVKPHSLLRETDGIDFTGNIVSAPLDLGSFYVVCLKSDYGEVVSLPLRPYHFDSSYDACYYACSY